MANDKRKRRKRDYLPYLALLAIGLILGSLLGLALSQFLITVSVQEMGTGYGVIAPPFHKLRIKWKLSVIDGELYLVGLKISSNETIPAGTQIYIEILKDDTVIATVNITVSVDIPAYQWIYVSLDEPIRLRDIGWLSGVYVVVLGP